MGMTVARLHKLLGDLVAQGHGRKPVCIDKSTFHHPLEQDGAVVLGVDSIHGPKFIANCDDEGDAALNEDGTESGRYTVILAGNGRG